MRIGFGFDLHRLAEGLPFCLGNVEIPHSKGYIAHSDGDVLIHSICDALLGALALKDIGHHFPDNDPAYKGISSAILLEKVHLMIREKGYSIVNIDTTIILEKPKIGPYIDRIQQRLAEILHSDPDRISIKATTAEKTGAIGNEEAVSAYTVCLLERD